MDHKMADSSEEEDLELPPELRKTHSTVLGFTTRT